MRYPKKNLKKKENKDTWITPEFKKWLIEGDLRYVNVELDRIEKEFDELKKRKEELNHKLDQLNEKEKEI